MTAIAYCNPFVPPEWIAAHGLRPCWLRCRTGEGSATSGRRGVCPVAAAIIDDARAGMSAAALILTTTCDQIRYAAAALEHEGSIRVFLFHVPRTWQTAAVRAFYGEELHRLGRFLVDCGGTPPTVESLAQTILDYDRARESLRARRFGLSVTAHAEASTAVRGFIPINWNGWHVPELQAKGVRIAETHPSHEAQGRAILPLALLGGPMSSEDYELLEAVEAAGVRFVLDATESGERTLPAAVDPDWLASDPREELVRIYFDGIPDVFQRPNDRLFAWLRTEVERRGVRGVLVRRYVGCDHWHGEISRLREKLAVPLLEWDAANNDPRARAARWDE